MSPPHSDNDSNSRARRPRTARHASSSRSPSNARPVHRHPSDMRSARDAKHDRNNNNNNHAVTSASPPPPKRRRRSESRSPTRHRHRDRSRSPYHRQERSEKRSHGEGRARSRSPHRHHHRTDKRSNRRESPPGRASQSPPRRDARRSKRDDDERDAAAVERRSRKPLPDQEVAFRGELDPESGALAAPIVKEKPNFANTGLLAKEANTVAGTKIVLKYNEPPEARKPPASQKWQLYVFKGDDIVDEVPLYTQSCWLLGREAAVADIHVEHPSSSKQHAVIQFRHSVKMNEFGDKQNIVRPYLIDLESANGTRLNGDKIKDSRYYEIRDKDMVKIGLSEREYVFMLPPSK